MQPSPFLAIQTWIKHHPVVKFFLRNGLNLLLLILSLFLLTRLVIKSKAWDPWPPMLQVTQHRLRDCLFLVSVIATVLAFLIGSVTLSTYRVWFNYRLERGEQVARLTTPADGATGIFTGAASMMVQPLAACFHRWAPARVQLVSWVLILLFATFLMHASRASAPYLMPYKTVNMGSLEVNDSQLGRCNLPELPMNYTDHANRLRGFHSMLSAGRVSALGQFILPDQLTSSLSPSFNTSAVIPAARKCFTETLFRRRTEDDGYQATKAPDSQLSQDLHKLILASVVSINGQSVTECSLRSVLGLQHTVMNMSVKYPDAVVRFSIANTAMLNNYTEQFWRVLPAHVTQQWDAWGKFTNQTCDTSMYRQATYSSGLSAQQNDSSSGFTACADCWGRQVKGFRCSPDPEAQRYFSQGWFSLMAMLNRAVNMQRLLVGIHVGGANTSYVVETVELYGRADVHIAYDVFGFKFDFSNLRLDMEDHLVTLRARACEFVTAVLESGPSMELFDLCGEDGSKWNDASLRTDEKDSFRLSHNAQPTFPDLSFQPGASSPSTHPLNLETLEFWRGVLIAREYWRTNRTNPGAVKRGPFLIPDERDISVALDAVDVTSVTIMFGVVIVAVVLVLCLQEWLCWRCKSRPIKITPFMLLGRLPGVIQDNKDVSNDDKALWKWMLHTKARLQERDSHWELIFEDGQVPDTDEQEMTELI